LRALIVDDEPPARSELRYLLEQVGGMEVCGEASTGNEALRAAWRKTPDVVFLDIHLPGYDGFAVARKLLDSDNPPFIVFATAYDRYAVEAFQVSAVDYLLKPFRLDRLTQTVNRLRRNLATQRRGEEVKTLIADLLRRLEGAGGDEKAPQKITALRDGRLFPLDPGEILCAYVEDEQVHVIGVTGRYTTGGTLNDLESRLAGGPFLRSHRRWLVNLDHIKEVIPWSHGTYRLLMKNTAGIEVPVGRSRALAVKSAIGLA
jgi:DNA-binding LytR/AlgR family response regulator